MGSISNLDTTGKFVTAFGEKGFYNYKYNSNNYLSRASVFGSNGTLFGIAIAENCNNCETHVKKFKLK